VVEVKDKEPNSDSKFDLENIENGHIIDGDPTAIVMTTTIQPEEPVLKRGSTSSIHICG
jgi:hypothetical protein